ncbi:TonB-dependent receptor [Polaribacter septentrionalilitoris]|uniref:TonB-dependent receptor n=1 Tax=Polaribacter septentrionalilitoris TaxID=2494657 RepID=UPI00135703FC|nr:Plug domain-containing protein [Polaribacter septentrionalilitoris]
MKRKRIYITSLVVTAILFSAFSKKVVNDPLFDRVFGKLALYSTKHNPEKIYLQTDKDFYTNGETIWFKTYLLDGITHTKSNKSKLVYVDLVDMNDSIIIQKKIYIDGKNSHGDIKINKKIKQGKYILRSYTKYMLNLEEPVFFQKEIPIWKQNIAKKEVFTDNDKLNISNTIKGKTIKPSFQFFPEGGDLVFGLKSTIGIKVTDSIGNGIELQGKIIDQNNKTITAFKTYKFGLGLTNFKPEIGKKYFAVTTINNAKSKYKLPTPLNKGYVLTVQNRGKFVKVRVETNIKDGLNGTLLLGHLRGDTFFKHIIKSKNKTTFFVKIMLKGLPDGVAHFTLFTPNEEPVCERLTFVDHPDNDISIKIKTNKENYNLRDKVGIDLNLTDKKGKTLKGDFSMSVITNSNFKKENNTIKSWFLLDSDLGGTIENANYFFENNSLERRYLLNALMLTHGWRRFVWKDFLKNSVLKKNSFEPEKGIMIQGVTTNFKNQYQYKKSNVTLKLFEQGLYEKGKTTNLQGKFTFGPFIFNDTVKGVIEAKDIKSNKQKDFSIHITNNLPLISIHITNNLPLINSRTIKKKTKNYKIEYVKEYLKEALDKKISDFKYDPGATELEEVIVITKKRKTKSELIKKQIEEQIKELSIIHGIPDKRIFRDSIPNVISLESAFDLLRFTAGVRVFGMYPNQRIMIRGGMGSVHSGKSSLILVDGLQVTQEFASSIRASEVDFIDVLKGASAAIYGMRGGNGVIAIYMRGSLNIIDYTEKYPGITNFEIKGFSKAREFYKPNYTIPKPEHEKPDYRTTLHWEPNLKLTSNQDKTINFFSGDRYGKYLVKIEGITDDGRAVNGFYNFRVTDQLDLK